MANDKELTRCTFRRRYIGVETLSPPPLVANDQPTIKSPPSQSQTFKVGQRIIVCDPSDLLEFFHQYPEHYSELFSNLLPDSWEYWRIRAYINDNFYRAIYSECEESGHIICILRNKIEIPIILVIAGEKTPVFFIKPEGVKLFQSASPQNEIPY